MEQPFGEAAIVLRDVVMDTTIGQAQFAFSTAGTMVFLEGPNLGGGGIAWVDRDGSGGPLPVPERVYGVLDLDPTDTRVAVQAADFEDYVWSYDLAGERGRRLPGKQTGWPVWSSRGRAVAYCADDQHSIRIESMDGSTGGRSIAVDRRAIPGLWSPCGELFYCRGDSWMSVEIQTEPELTWSAVGLCFVAMSALGPWSTSIPTAIFFLMTGALAARLLGLLVDGAVPKQWLLVAVEAVVMAVAAFWLWRNGSAP